MTRRTYNGPTRVQRAMNVYNRFASRVRTFNPATRGRVRSALSRLRARARQRITARNRASSARAGARIARGRRQIRRTAPRRLHFLGQTL